MLRLSPDVLSAIMVFVTWIQEGKIKNVSEIKEAPDIYHLHPEDILEISIICKYVVIEEGKLHLADDFFKQHSDGNIKNTKDIYRIILSSYILNVQPAWSGRIPYGRKETSIFMSKDEQACFYEAGLLDEIPSNEAVNWWDQVAFIIRNRSNGQKNIIGRDGEKLTLKYELNRTGLRPTWIAIDTNRVGYDIKSYVDRNNRDILLIEVKTSMNPLDRAWFHITNNEWITAQTARNYLFYLWCLYNNNIRLAKISSRQLGKFVPQNQTGGQWESAKIPFSCFLNDFQLIDKGLLYENN